jgi:hypothetical protein
MRPFRLVPFLFFLLFTVGAHAQLGIYGEFSAANLNVPATGWIYGTTFGAYFDKGHLLFLGTGLDIRGSFLERGSTTLNSGLIGPRLVFRPHVLPIQPYVEALGGFGHASLYEGPDQMTVNKFEYQFLGGLDLTILPRIDWRVLEFSYGGLSGLGTSFSPKTVSTGVVVRLP